MSTIARPVPTVNNTVTTHCNACRATVYAPHECPHRVSADALPEAPSSLNIYVETPMGRIQATARGHNEVETVARLALMVDAIRARFAPRPDCPDCGTALDHDRRDLAQCTRCALAAERQLTREQRLGLLLAKGIACAVSKQDSSLVDRLGKAAALVMNGAVEPTERAQAMAVRSQSTPSLYYTVEGQHCSCPDAANRPERSCKHKLAVEMTARLHD